MSSLSDNSNIGILITKMRWLWNHLILLWESLYWWIDVFLLNCPQKKLHTRPQHRKIIIYSFCTQNMSPSQEKWQSFHHKNVYYKICCYIYWSLLIVSAHTIPYNYFFYQTNHYGHPLLLPQWVVRFVYPQFQLWPTLRGISCRYLTCKHNTYINNIHLCDWAFKVN